MRLAALALLFWIGACHSAAPRDADTHTRIVLKMQPLWGDPAPFRALLDDFRRQHPELELVTELVPNASDLAHQFYLTALGAESATFDVLVSDVVWVPEFARAGFLADLSDAFPRAELARDFLPGPTEAVLLEGRTFAVPWFVDVGLLYYRKDLVPRAPRSYDELTRFAQRAMQKDASLSGYVWQGKQYEGLTCNVYEAIWGHGGRALDARGRLALGPDTARALAYLRSLLTSGISPGSVTSSGEEEARRIFQSGKAVFMRNWPYALEEAEAEGSPIRGKVAVTTLPTRAGEPGAGALGGYQLALNAHAPASHRAPAIALIRHLTSSDANLVMAVHYARNPPRRAIYEDPRLFARAPRIAALRDAVENARPRPVTPYYVLLADILQSEFSAAIAGIRSPDEAVERARRLSAHLMAGAP